jgi:hypothetical protein
MVDEFSVTRLWNRIKPYVISLIRERAASAISFPGGEGPSPLLHYHNNTDGTPKLLGANTHESPDTDTATTALHHTIGASANQAAAGNHLHSIGGSASSIGDYLFLR